MLTLFKSRVVVIWAVLVAATVCSLELFRLPGLGIDPRLIGASVLVIALLKARFIGFEFMELRHAPLGLRLAFDIWLLLIGGVLITLFWLQS